MFQPVHHSTVYTTETHTHAVKQAAALCLGGDMKVLCTPPIATGKGTQFRVPGLRVPSAQFLRTRTSLRKRTSRRKRTPHAAYGAPPLPAHACAVGGARVRESERASPPSRRCAAQGNPGLVRNEARMVSRRFARAHPGPEAGPQDSISAGVSGQLWGSRTVFQQPFCGFALPPCPVSPLGLATFSATTTSTHLCAMRTMFSTLLFLFSVTPSKTDIFHAVSSNIFQRHSFPKRPPDAAPGGARPRHPRCNWALKAQCALLGLGKGGGRGTQRLGVVSESSTAMDNIR